MAQPPSKKRRDMTNKEKTKLAEEIIEEKFTNPKSIVFKHPTNLPQRPKSQDSRKKRLAVHNNISFADLIEGISMSSVGGFRNKKTKKAKYSRRSKKIKQYKN
jgi:hypothetical protein